MKVPPKRKGNTVLNLVAAKILVASMKVPPKRKGNIRTPPKGHRTPQASMKVPPKRKGNVDEVTEPADLFASMKVPPKRKGNPTPSNVQKISVNGLNESPSEKEGKSQRAGVPARGVARPQ